jgi:hypothetical protein
MPVDKVSIQKFAQTIKVNHTEYKDIDDTALTNAIIQKYPQYKETVDLGQPEVSTDKKKDVGASGFTNTPTQTVTPSTGLAFKDFNDFSQPKSLLPYQGNEQPTVKQNNFGIGNLVSDHPIKSVQIKPLPNDVKTVDEIHNETLNNSSNIINSILNNPDKAIDNIVKTQREEKLKQMFSPDLSKEDINKAKDLQFNYLMKK